MRNILKFYEEASGSTKEDFDNIKINLPTDKNIFDRLLKNIRSEIEFCMEYKIDKDKIIPKGLIDSLADLHKVLEGYFK